MSEEPSTKAKAAALAERLAASTRLRQRRFELLPLSGPGAVFTEVQGRMPGDSTSAEGLADLIASIGSIGVLQPILVEELNHGARRLVAGERRLRACRIGSVDDPSNPHFQAIPAVVCPGPLAADERMTWQLVENLARTDLQPGELGAALVFERCALLQVRLEQAGCSPPADVLAHDDPVRRWQALERFRSQEGHHSLGAPWPDVLHRLGLPLSEDKAHQIWRALKDLPAEMTEEMDEQGVTLNTRIAFLRLARTRQDAATELWDAVRSTKRGQLLFGAIQEQLQHPELAVDSALDRAAQRHQAANESRATKLRRSEPVESTDEVPVTVVRATLDALAGLTRALRSGKVLGRYDTGSIRLYLAELTELLGTSDQPVGGLGQPESMSPDEAA